jgi:hypothetical protein
LATDRDDDDDVTFPIAVMRGLVPRSSMKLLCSYERDCRVKPGNDAEMPRT